MLKIEVFCSFFSADGLHDSGYFIGYSFKISRNKASTIFYDTAIPKTCQEKFLCRIRSGGTISDIAGVCFQHETTAPQKTVIYVEKTLWRFPMSNLENESHLRLPQVLKIIPISKSAWWQGCKDGRYPKPIKLGPRTTVWKASDISAFMRQLSRSPVQDESNGVKQ